MMGSNFHLSGCWHQVCTWNLTEQVSSRVLKVLKEMSYSMTMQASEGESQPQSYAVWDIATWVSSAAENQYI